MDEDVTHRLKGELREHEVLTVADMGWLGVKNGELLTLADSTFDVLVTADRNLRHQQNLARLQRLAVVVLAARNTSINTIRPLVPRILALIGTVRPGTAIEWADRGRASGVHIRPARLVGLARS